MIDLDEIGHRPFSFWVRWYQHEANEPFLDRRLDLQAFLICRVLAGVIHQQITPTEEMFTLSAPLHPDTRDPEDLEHEAEERSFRMFESKMARHGL